MVSVKYYGCLSGVSRRAYSQVGSTLPLRRVSRSLEVRNAALSPIREYGSWRASSRCGLPHQRFRQLSAFCLGGFLVYQIYNQMVVCSSQDQPSVLSSQSPPKSANPLHHPVTPQRELDALTSNPLTQEESLLLQANDPSPEHYKKLARLLISNGGHRQWSPEMIDFLKSFDGLQVLLDTLLQGEWYESVFRIGKTNFNTLYEIAKNRHLKFDWGEKGVERSCFLKKVRYGGCGEQCRPYQTSCDVYIMLKINPDLSQTISDEGKTVFALALEQGNSRIAKEILGVRENLGFSLSEEEGWMRKALLDDCDFSIVAFQKLPRSSQENIYALANIHNSIGVVARLNALGLREGKTTYNPRGLQMLSESMDALQAWEAAGAFLVEQRKNGALLTPKEFQDLQNVSAGTTFLKKGDMNRLIGRNLIEKTIEELHLSHVKVPKKIAVINEKAAQSGEIQLRRFTGNLHLTSDDLSVYAQKIHSSKRFLRLEEMEELITLIEEVHFEDIWPFNFVVADDGVYCIDTEYKSFGPVPYGKLFRLERLLDPKDAPAFERLLRNRYDASQARIQVLSDVNWEEKYQQEILSEKYFGLDKRQTPFRFSLEELVNIK